MVALKLKDGKQPLSSDNYKDDELMTYDTAKNSTPYVAARFTSDMHVEGQMFILGDGGYTDDPISRTVKDYFNGPLESGTSYRIFQRLILNEKVWISE